ncbi:MAG: AraC family transcriptional regulator [Polaromonas sp.]
MPTQSQPSVDRLAALFQRFRVQAELFHTGALCGVSSFPAKPGRGFLHVLRRGEMVLTHQRGAAVPRRIQLNEPTLMFYPQSWTHEFHNAPAKGCEFTCATLDFEGGSTHPLVRALPPLVLVSLSRVPGLDSCLNLLFAETDNVRCGHRFLADRLFEVVLMQLLRWLLDHPVECGVQSGLIMGLADPALARSLTAMHDQPGAPWSLQAMAEQAGMSRSSFAARFKEVVGATPADYLADWRLTIAKSLLINRRSVKHIADELGYANASALSRVFAQRVGVSPRDWLATTVEK